MLLVRCPGVYDATHRVRLWSKEIERPIGLFNDHIRLFAPATFIQAGRPDPSRYGKRTCGRGRSLHKPFLQLKSIVRDLTSRYGIALESVNVEKSRWTC